MPVRSALQIFRHPVRLSKRMVLVTVKTLSKKPLQTDSKQSRKPLLLAEEEHTLCEGEDVESCRAAPISEQPFTATSGCS